MENLNVTNEQFLEACQLETEGANKKLFDRILAVDDFISFKRLMIKRNKELEREVLETLQNEINSNIKKENNNSDNEEIKEMEERLKLSNIYSERKKKESEQDYNKYLEDLDYAIKLSKMESINVETTFDIENNIDKKMEKIQDKEHKHKNIEKNKSIDSKIKQSDDNLNVLSVKIDETSKNNDENIFQITKMNKRK
jgi:hypothetical protein